MSSASTAISVVKSALQKQSVVRFVCEDLPRGFTVVERFGLVGLGGGENDKSNVVAGVAGAPAVVFAVNDVEAVAAGQHGAALVVFRIAHGQKVGGINRDEQLKIDFASGKLVSELSEKALKFTARRIVGDAEGIANGFENPTALFARSISVGSKLIDSVDVIVSFVVWTGEKSNSTFNQQEAFAIGVPLGGTENRVGKIVHKNVVGIMRFGAVDDDGLKLLIPTLRTCVHR